MCYWSLTSLVHFWPPPILNPRYFYGGIRPDGDVCYDLAQYMETAACYSYSKCIYSSVGGHCFTDELF